MTLPGGEIDPDREFQGQIFARHKIADESWNPWRIPGFIHRDTGIFLGAMGVASVQVAKFNGGQTAVIKHNCDILFTFVMEGSITLKGHGQEPHELKPGDAFVILPEMQIHYSNCSCDLELLEVALPGEFEAVIIDE
ncbi:MAG: cupin domain-containing protein [Hyphomicrobiales bacterium]|nr:cupin domain-containing protein [Hyphomicrobiales bacterium]